MSKPGPESAAAESQSQIQVKPEKEAGKPQAPQSSGHHGQHANTGHHHAHPSHSSHVGRRLSWGPPPKAATAKNSGHLGVAGDDLPDTASGSRKSLILGSGEVVVEISHWPPADPFQSRGTATRQSNEVAISGTKIKPSWKICNCLWSLKKKAPLSGILDGPVVKIDTSILPIDYFSTYQGNIHPTATALIAANGPTYTFEELNLISDLLAKQLKPMIEAELKLERSRPLLEDMDWELCVALAFPPSEKWIVVILSIWKLGLSYLPIRIDDNPYRRIAKTLEVIHPLVVIVSNADSTLKTAAEFSKSHVVFFEDLWRKMEEQKKDGKPLWSKEEREAHLTIGKLVEYRKDNIHPSQRTSAVLHRLTGKGEVVTTCVRNSTIWNRLRAEWQDFPYSTNEITAIHSAVDTHEYLGQLLTPLLAGIPAVAMHVNDLYEFADNVAKWKIRRLKIFPDFLRAILKFLELAKGRPEAQMFDSVREWFCTGGSLRRELAISFFTSNLKDCRLINLYGCKEALSFVCYEIFTCLREVKYGAYYDILPIGRPVINTRIYVLDEDGEVTENSGLGEVYISGLCVSTSLRFSRGLTSESETNCFNHGTKIVPNPNLKEEEDRMYGALLKIMDFGKLVYSTSNKYKLFGCFLKDKPTLQLAGNGEGEANIENYRVNTNELIFHIKSMPGVKACHVMVYRPGTQTMAILAFVVVAHRHQLTREEVHLYLRNRVPTYMIPTIIFIPGIPVKDFKINNTQLVETYQKERMISTTLEHQVSLLGFQSASPEMRAASSLFRILFHCCGVGEQWVSTHMNWVLSELHISFTALPRILKELQRHGYNIDMKSYFAVKTPKDMLQLMTQNVTREDIAAEVIEGNSCGQFVVEIISKKHRGEMCKFFIESNYGYKYKKSIFYYSLMTKKQIQHTLLEIWPLIVSQPYSIAVRDKSTNQVVAALLSADHEEKLASPAWEKISSLKPNKYYAEMLDEIEENMKIHGLTSSKTLQTLFFLVDPSLEKSYKDSIQVTKLLITKAMEIGRQNDFKILFIPIFDYFYSALVAESFNFDIVDSRQINTFETKDGIKPFFLAPDNISATVLHAVL